MKIEESLTTTFLKLTAHTFFDRCVRKKTENNLQKRNNENRLIKQIRDIPRIK